MYSKSFSDQECKENHKQFALHVKVRSEECSLSDKILELEEKFERYIASYVYSYDAYNSAI